MNLLHFPEEILIHIITLLSAPMDRLRFSSTCHTLRRIAAPLLDRLCLNFTTEDVQSCVKTWAQWKVSNIQLDFQSYHGSSVNLNNTNLWKLLEQCTTLTIINSMEGWQKYVHFPEDISCSISTINIKNSSCTFPLPNSKYGSLLDQCTISSTDQFVNQCKEVVDIRLCHKTRIAVKNCNFLYTEMDNKKITDDFLDKILCRQHRECMNDLTNLCLDGCLINDNFVHSIGRLYPNLTVLSLNRCPNLSSKFLITIGKMMKLQELYLSGQNEVRSLACLSNLPSLKTLDVAQCKRLNDISGLMEIITNFESLDFSGITASLELLTVFCMDKLKYLNLQGCYQVSDNFLGRLKLPKLNKLNISSCVRVTDKMLPSLISTTDCMNDLNLSWLKKVKPVFFTDISSISRLFWRIKRLNLSNMNMTDKCLLAIQSANPVSLEVLNIALCKDITDRGISNLRTIPSLKELDISHLCNITDHGLIPLVRKLHQLKSLKMDGCVSVTDSFVRILSHCRSLQYLSCTQCSLVTNEAVEEITEVLPRLSTVNFVKKVNVNL